MAEKRGLKLGATICGDDRWDAEAGNPPSDESGGNCFRGGVLDRNGLWPAGKAIHAGQQIGATTGGRQRADQINVDVVKALIGWQKLAKRSLGVAGHFAQLTGGAAAGPFPDVLLHAGPDVACRNHTLSGTNTRMCKGVQAVEDGLAKGQRYKRAGSAGRHVAHHRLGSGTVRDWLKLQRRLRVLLSGE